MVRRPGAPVSGRALRSLILVPLLVLATVYVWETGTGQSLAGHRFGAENYASQYEPASDSLAPGVHACIPHLLAPTRGLVAHAPAQVLLMRRHKLYIAMVTSACHPTSDDLLLHRCP